MPACSSSCPVRSPARTATPPARSASILDGDGAYTQVDGEKTLMKYGDFVLTPSWTAHDHGNESKKPMIWLDVLDVPTINFFETAFSEHLDARCRTPSRQDNDSLWRYGSGVLPDGSRRQEQKVADHQLRL